MAKYRLRPIMVEAHRIGDDGWPAAIWQGVCDNRIVLHLDNYGRDTSDHILVKTPDRMVIGYVGEYVILLPGDEFRVLDAATFAARFDPMDEGPDKVDMATALRPLVDKADGFHDDEPGDIWIDEGVGDITLADCRRAREVYRALTGKAAATTSDI